MVESRKNESSQLSVAQLNTFLDTLQSNVAASKLSTEAKDDLLKSIPAEFLPIAVSDTERGSVRLNGQLPSTFGELSELAHRSMKRIRDGHDTGGLSDHAEQVEYNRIIQGALGAVEKTMGQAR